MSTLEEKVIILVAPNGERASGEGHLCALHSKEIAEDAFRCYQAGASIVHVTWTKMKKRHSLVLTKEL